MHVAPAALAAQQVQPSVGAALPEVLVLLRYLRQDAERLFDHHAVSPGGSANGFSIIAPSLRAGAYQKNLTHRHILYPTMPAA